MSQRLHDSRVALFMSKVIVTQVSDQVKRSTIEQKKLFWTAKTPKVCQNHKRLRNVTHNTSETALQLFIPELLKIKTLVKAWLLVDTVLLHR